MKAYGFLYMTAAALLISACSDKEEGIGEPVAATVQAGISTRATVDNTWTAGEDAIGVYVTSAGATKGSNIKYVASDHAGSFSPAYEPIYFVDGKDVTFCAYYPYTDDSEMNSDGTINWKGGIVKDGKCQWDFLFADGATARKSSPVVSFTGDKAFRHCMAMVKFTIKAGYGIESGEKLLNFIMDEVHNDGVVDPRDGTVMLSAEKTALTEPVNQTLGNDLTISIILLPQAVTDKSIDIILETSVEDTKNKYSTALTAPAGGKFVGGSVYSYTIRVTNAGIKFENLSIETWQIVDQGNLNIDA